MEISFLQPFDWKSFYSQFEDVDSDQPNEQGWINVDCNLPTHPKVDTKRHGGINLQTGRYKCFNLECVAEYQQALGLTSSRETLSAEQYLRVKNNLTPDEAKKAVDSFRLEPLEVLKSPDAIHFNSFSKVFRPSLTWNTFVEDAQEKLSPDLDIVKEYMESRGIAYETLVEAGVGYVPDSTDGKFHQYECLIHPYFVGNQIVGIRGRTIDGRKGGVKDSYSTFYGLQLLPEEPPDTVIIAEGETDALVLRQFLRKNNIQTPVLGIPGSTYDQSWNRHIQGIRRVIFVAQTDTPSQRLAQLIVNSIPRRSEAIQLPFGPRDVGKDVADFISLGEFHHKKLLDLLGLQTEEIVRPYAYGLVDLFKASEEEVAWNVRGILEQDTKIFLAGEPKTHKTWLALELAQAIYTGTPWLGNPEWSIPIRGQKTLFVEEEGSFRRLGQRVRAIFADLDPEEHDKAIQVVHQQRVRLDEVPSTDKLREKILDYWPDMLILDPLVNLHSLDENAASDMTIILDTINMLMRLRPGMSVVIIHHFNHAGYLRGSSSLFGGVDAQVTLKKEEDYIALTAKGREIDELEKVEIHFNTETKRHYVYTDPAKPEEDWSYPDEKTEEAVLAYLHKSDTKLVAIGTLRQGVYWQNKGLAIPLINKSISRLVNQEKLRYSPNGLYISLNENS